jgi:UDP-GlcNAc:undecaprenyl-phosphate GlcNAc-1-phosphate transferase
VDHPDTRKHHRAPVPRAGGIAIFLGYAAAMAMRGEWAILPAVLAAFGTGLLDDLVGLKPRTKISGQILAALLACGAGVQILGAGAWWHMPLTIVWLVGCTNAVNLIDGLDGLAAGVGVFAAVAAIGTGNAALALVAPPLLGAMLGFLIYNFSPASIFMGDCGSNTVGFLLGCFGVMWSGKSASLAGMSGPVIALAIPILDTGLAIFRRFLRNEPIFAADRGHIHHRLLARGFSPRRVAAILYTGAGFFACLSVHLTNGTYSRGPVLAAFGIVIWLALRYLRYDEFDCVRRVIFGGVLRRSLSADLMLREFEEAIGGAQSIEECWCALEDHGRRLGLRGASMQVYGRTFRALFRETETSGDSWSLRVALNGAGVIELDVPFGAATPVGPLTDLLRNVLAPKLETFRPQLAFAAAAGRRMR